MSNRLAILSAALAASLAASAPARAQEFTILGGSARANAPSESTYSWAFSYLQPLDDYNALSFTWLNEGHFTEHHRDGFALQYWRRAWFFDRRLALAAGIGAYDYFDTTASDQGKPYSDAHGVALIYSVSATWYTHSPWFFQARVNRTDASHSIHTTAALIGVGYQLGTATSAPVAFPAGYRDELTLLAGKTTVNSLHSPGAFAKSVEFRHGFGDYIDATLTWLDEGDTVLTRRNGGAAQVWLSRGFFGDKLRLAVGAGPYVSIDTYRVSGGTNTSDKVSALVTMSASYQFARHWIVRASWDRVLTGYDKDSDIYLAGIGYRF